MRSQGILLAFYQSREDAAAAQREIRRLGAGRVALVRQPGGGWAQVLQRSTSLGPLLAGLAAFLAGTAAGPGPALIAFLATVLLLRLLRPAVDLRTVARFSRLLFAGETLLIVQAGPRTTGRAMTLLRRLAHGQLAVFALHPHPPARLVVEPLAREPLPAGRLPAQARRLAAAHLVETERDGRGEPLLRRLEDAQRMIQHVHRSLEEASRLEQGISPPAEWLLDNAYIILGQIRDVRDNLPRSYYHQLPVLAGGPRKGLPRVYDLANELVADTDGRLTRENIGESLAAYQEVSPLNIGELWALPLMLRLALLERVHRLAVLEDRRLHDREWADFWANRLLGAARREPASLPRLVAELSRERADAGYYFAFQLTGHLYDEEAALAPARSWLEGKLGHPLPEIIADQQGRLAADQVSIANAVSSLRHLSLLDWRETFEELSQVEAILRQDPAGVYGQMDFLSRDACRRAVERVSRRSPLGEAQVAELAVEMAGRADVADDPRRRHPGFFLVDEGRPELEERAASPPDLGTRLGRRLRRHHAPLYIGGIGAVTLLAEAGAFLFAGLVADDPWVVLGVALLAILPASELASQIVNYLVARLVPPRPLPKLSFEKTGIPEECRTLVVVPMILLGREAIRRQVRLLEVNQLANPDPQLAFALFSDFSDAPAPEAAEDAELLAIAAEGIEELNRRHGAGRFFLFHRPRSWAESERRWIGWERKRGKLEELNRLICGLPTRQGVELVRVGDPERLPGFRYVITLDADTRLPRDSARRLVETIAHPLNRAQTAPDGRTVLRGYGVIQPRVSTSLPSATATLFTRFFTDPTGSDPYTRVISDVHQDLSGEGSYHGKGIYDPRVFQEVLGGRFPDQTLLSHDLIEGCHVRVGLASDIELLDDFPAHYLAYASRQHRWVRGDWQIAEHCLPRVPWPLRGAGGETEWARQPNPLTPLNRWKIFDNLRRSLATLFSLGLLLAGWLASPHLAVVVSALIGALFLFPPLSQLLGWLIAWPPGGRPISWPQLRVSLGRALLFAALLPHQAGLNLDAIVRVAFRRLVSRRRLLEWTTAQVAHWEASRRLRNFLLSMGLVSLFAAGVGAGLLALDRVRWLAALPFLLLWFASPLIGWRLTFAPRRAPSPALAAGDRLLLRSLARETWRYFDDLVDARGNWLPPDNYQVSHRTELALRTSPTNIGLWLLSCLAARDLGYLTPGDAARRIGLTLETLSRMERYAGHLLNWYDTASLQPLRPRYVSSVDSGNLLGAFWALEEGLRELPDEPLVGPPALEGLADALAVLRDRLGKAEVGDTARQALAILERLLTQLPQPAIEVIGRLRLAKGAARTLAEALRQEAAPDPEAVYWAERLHAQAASWGESIDRYLSWAEALAREGEAALGGPEAPAAELRRAVLARAPSLRELAGGFPALEPLLRRPAGDGEGAGPGADPAPGWLRGLAGARGAAAALLAEIEGCARQAAELGEGMSLRFLYDPQRRLFSVGFDVQEQRLDSSFYDLLASEARLASFVAIARGEVPSEHWLSLGRPYGSVFGRRVLLSWSGTMFEYLMPTLLVRLYRNSLLDQACRQAVEIQADFGRRHGVPWGVSEAAFSALDANRIYQYRAFGVPGLGLKRGLEEDLVVSPYSSALALPLDPPRAIRNLRRLIGQGLRGPYGFFESIDYTRERRPEGEAGVVVHAYMAHHQAMTLLALAGALTGQAMPRRFHAHPRVRATEPLLYERIPVVPPLFTVTSRNRPPAARQLGRGPARSASRLETPHTAAPRTLIQSNGRYSLMVTHAGGGYSRWKGQDITRWRADTTRDACGTFLYLRDRDSGEVWSAGYQPTCREPRSYSALFTVDHLEIRRRDFGLETITEVALSPEDDAEVRRVTLVNQTGRPRRIEVTSYAELALAPHDSDGFHPAFSRMFVQTEALPGSGLLLAWRRPRGPEEEPVCAAHLLRASLPDDEPPSWETDRRRFLGRAGSLQRPPALEGELSGSAGTVLDPLFSLRRRFTLPPAGRARLSLVTLAAGTRAEALALAEKYDDLAAAGRALELAWTRAQLELRHLRVHPEDARRFQQLAGLLLYPGARLRPSAGRLRQNRLGRERLWPLGLGGDLPIAVITISEIQDLAPVREMLHAHTYWRMHGLSADLVVLNEEGSGYESPLHEHLGRMIQGLALHTGVDQPGGVHLRRADQLHPEEVTLLLAAARVVLVATRGPLAQQLGTPAEAQEIPPRLAVAAPPPEEPSPPLPFLELPYFNGLGGFTAGGREYAVYLGPRTVTPAPWVNVMANPRFGQLVSESGSGFVWQANSQSNRLTEWSNDPLADPPGEALYIRDEESGLFWSPTPLPVRELDAYRARHGAGYTLFEHNSHNILQELLTFVPVDEEGGEPLRIQRLRLTNPGERSRRLSVTAYTEWVLGSCRERMQAQTATSWDARSQALMARNPFGGQPEAVAFAAANPPPASFTADRAMFLGRHGSLAAPAALQRRYLSGRSGAGMDPCAALQVQIELEPGQSAEAIFLLGQAENGGQAQRLIRRFREPLRVEEAWARSRSFWDGLLERVRITTPEPSADLLVNRWLLYQTISCRLWARSALYQSSGAYGFRDQLQDVLALLQVAPELAREQILRAASRQFAEGDVEHWWHPGSGVGVRTRCSDDLLWLPFAVAEYLRVTGDEALLDERLPFLEAPPLAEGQAESLVTHSQTSAGEEPLWEHCRRAIERASTAGPHGLPLFGSGDWNDGMNRVGLGGSGESVWLAWFLVRVLDDFSTIALRRGEGGLAEEYRRRSAALVERIETHAWDGGWYLRGWFDDGTPLGSERSEEARIDSLPQSWAALGGAGNPERVRQALESAWEKLVRPDERLVLLFAPPFDRTLRDPGYIKGYPPGVRENGGQYTHAAVWLAMAFARLGEGDRAVELLRLINPVEHSRDPAGAERYRVEPYVMTADVYAAEGRAGQGGWTWYTGSAAWMYRAWVEEVCGLRRRGPLLHVDPCIPAGWEEFRIHYRHESAENQIHVRNPEHVCRGVARVELDGEQVPGGAIPLADDGARHAVEVLLGPRG